MGAQERPWPNLFLAKTILPGADNVSVWDLSAPIPADHYGSAEIMFVRAARCILA